MQKFSQDAKGGVEEQLAWAFVVWRIYMSLGKIVEKF